MSGRFPTTPAGFITIIWRSSIVPSFVIYEIEYFSLSISPSYFTASVALRYSVKLFVSIPVREDNFTTVEMPNTIRKTTAQRNPLINLLNILPKIFIHAAYRKIAFISAGDRNCPNTHATAAIISNQIRYFILLFFCNH